jgi:homeobox protein ESX1
MPPWPPLENPNKVGAKLMLAPVLPDFPELPESPEVAELRLLLAFPVLPESALPDLAVVSLEEEESALPLFPPWAEPLAVLAPELPDVAPGEPVAVDEPELPDAVCWGLTPLAPAVKDPAISKTPPARPPTDAAFHFENFDMCFLS